MFSIFCQLVGLLGLFACLALATLALNKNRKSRQFLRRVFRRLSAE
jgi:hypothetical protein